MGATPRNLQSVSSTEGSNGLSSGSAARCPIKLNLALSVGHINDNGMHPLSSWMMAFDVGDDLLLRKTPDSGIFPEAHDAMVTRRVAEEPYAPLTIDWPVKSDLVHRAIQLLTKEPQALGKSQRLEAELTKRVPPGTGLGAGSSNAATTLIEGNRLLSLELTQAELCELAASLGADVPFFIHAASGSPSCIATGTGTTLQAIDDDVTRHAVLVLPGIHSATAAVYQAFDEAPTDLDHERVRGLPAIKNPEVLNQSLWNDLAPAAFRVCSDLRTIQNRAQKTAKQPVHLTGSGSALFTLVESPSSAEQLAENLRRDLSTPAFPIRSVSKPH